MNEIFHNLGVNNKQSSKEAFIFHSSWINITPITYFCKVGTGFHWRILLLIIANYSGRRVM